MTDTDGFGRARDLMLAVRSIALDRGPGILDDLKSLLRRLSGPRISGFVPTEGRAGSLISISGSNFAGERGLNRVVIGGKDAFVVEASATRLQGHCCVV